MNTPTTPAASSRRQFIGTTAAASALTVAQSAWAAGSDKVKIGLIG
ncbi:MAG: twin-arginine translocation signal domain-containing protein, partial [Verrucomicrobiaceae bacterium]|nr:twin-arginine translocation signal domain-containing protein [Verrucomicrobiaceae bacterium]